MLFSTDNLSLDNLPKIISGLLAAAVGMSIAYEFGYFVQIDSKLIGYFSIHDVLIDALVYVPLALAVFLIDVISWKGEAPYSGEVFPNRISTAGYATLIALLLGMLLVLIFSPNLAAQFIALTAVIWTLGFAAIKGIKDDKHRLNILLLFTCVVVLIFCFTTGSSRAYNELHGENTYDASLKINGQSIAATVLKVGTNVVVFRTQDRQVRVVPTKDVTEITYKVPSTRQTNWERFWEWFWPVVITPPDNE